MEYYAHITTHRKLYDELKKPYIGPMITEKRCMFPTIEDVNNAINNWEKYSDIFYVVRELKAISNCYVHNNSERTYNYIILEESTAHGAN